MDLKSINARIGAVNAESQRLNSVRQVNIGKRDTLNNQLNVALAQYKEKYGVELTVDSIQEELERVVREKEEEVSRIEQMISCINTGDFAGANRLAGVDSSVESELSSDEQVIDVTSKPNLVKSETQILDTPVMPDLGVSNKDTQVMPDLGTPVMPDLGTPVMPDFSNPVSRPFEDMMPSPVGSQSKALHVEDDLEIPAPPNFGKSKTSGVGLGGVTQPVKTQNAKSAVNSFSNILNGTEFRPE